MIVVEGEVESIVDAKIEFELGVAVETEVKRRADRGRKD
jgi:hypothetical protein